MSYMDGLKGKVYQAPEFRSKGRRMELEDSFFVREEGKAYVLFLTLNASLSGENRSYTYTLYSVQEEKTVEPDSPVFRSLASRLPPPEHAVKTGGNLDPMELFRLEMEYDALVGSFLQNGRLTETEKQKYEEYMDQMQAMQSPSFTAVYKAARALLN